MRAVDYALRQAWLSLLRARSGSLLAIAAIALAIVVLGALLLLTWNAEHVLSQWTSAAELSIYLRDDASSEQRGAIESLLERSGVVRGHQYVSKTEAQARFRRQFLELAKVTEEFGGHFDRRVDIDRVGFDPVLPQRRLRKTDFALEGRLERARF